MQTLNKRDFTSFKTLAQMTQPKLHNTVYQTLKSIYPAKTVTKTQDGVIAKGTIPICLIAHMDTVFKNPPTDIYYDREANIIWSPEGLGADDRAGVFAILKILSHGFRPHVIFTVDEEVGAIGAAAMALKNCPFDELKYIIELDRAHAVDCVFYDCGNTDFENYVEQFGFVTALGSFTDIVELCPAWKVAGVNLSIGYVNEHSVSETLNVGHMLATVAKVEKMLTAAEEAPTFEFISMYDEDFYPYGGYGYYGYGNYWGPTYHTCFSCGAEGDSYSLIPIYLDNQYKKSWLCADCITDENIEWCDSCYHGFVPGIINKKTNLCPRCEKSIERFKKQNEDGTRTFKIDSKSVQSSD